MIAQVFCRPSRGDAADSAKELVVQQAEFEGISIKGSILVTRNWERPDGWAAEAVAWGDQGYKCKVCRDKGGWYEGRGEEREWVVCVGRDCPW